MCYGSFVSQQKRRQSGTKIIQHSSVKSERKNRRKQFKTSEEKKDLNKDLNQYDGYIKIPKLNLELPVMEKKQLRQTLKKSPCIYSGTAKRFKPDNSRPQLQRHFGKINQLENGDKVQYTDLQNNTYNYCVTAKEKINGSNSEQMQNENYALTLFTCDYTGRDRITIRCERK